LKFSWAVLIIASILILGTLGLDQDAEATPQDDIQSIIDDVTALVNDDVVSEKDGKKLTEKLTKAIKDLDKGNIDKAIEDLNEFIKEVDKLVDKNKIPQPDGQSLIDAAEAIKDDVRPPKRISLRDMGIIQIATHDLVDVDRVAKIDREDGKLNLSTLFGHGEASIPLGGEGRNFSNFIIFNVMQKEFVQFYFDLIDNQGMSKDEAIQKTVEKFHVELAGTFERIFDEPLPKPRGGTVTFTENLALRTLHDLIPGRVIIGGTEVPAFGISPFTPVTDEELMQLGAEIDGVYDPELLAIFIPGRGFLNLLERDSTFATDLDTKFSLEFFLEELEDGQYDKTDKVMKEIRKMFSKGLKI